MSIQGAGYLTALDVLCDASYQLFEPIANTVVTGIALISGTTYQITVPNIASIYQGALVTIGYGSTDVEIVNVSSVLGNTFTATLLNPHVLGERIFGPTFPVQQPTDPLWTQAEMLAYLSSACNDFLGEVPLCYAVNKAVTVQATKQNAPLPADCMLPERVAFQTPAGPYPMRETSQSNLDGYDYRWQVAPPGTPRAYFRDKVPLQNFGIWPRANNTAVFEVVYQQRQTQVMQLLDGFLFPDIFLPIVKYRVFSFAYSKDGEARNPGLAKYFSTRYAFGVKVAKMVLQVIEDPYAEQ